MNKTRLETFSDGVIAILITIMVLELRAPNSSVITDLKPLIPTFLSYILSFLVLAIYWNNHHHLLYICKSINTKILWANIHLLFWLSLVPFVTNWMGDNYLSSVPVAVYGVVFLFAAFSFYILYKTIVQTKSIENKYIKTINNNTKGLLSLIFYSTAILFAFISTIISEILYGIVALMYLIPDRQIEKTAFVTNINKKSR